jgi:predicted lipid-binding transport protein (Tim44 family)
MTFCPKCGASLRIAQTATQPTPPQARRRDEKGEKREKEEKGEKAEKHEKGEYGMIGPLVGGLILILIGIAAFLDVAGQFRAVGWAVILVIVGIIIMFAAIYGAILASRRQPKP